MVVGGRQKEQQVLRFEPIEVKSPYSIFEVVGDDSVVLGRLVIYLDGSGQFEPEKYIRSIGLDRMTEMIEFANNQTRP